VKTEEVILQVWNGQGPTAAVARLLLLPLSWLFGLIVRVRNGLYDSGRLLVEKVDCPVISVGNLTVGGSGKTPVVLWLVEEMLRRGIRPVVVSRGYGRHSEGTVVLLPDRALELDAAKVAGDEAVLIARRSGVPVVVSERRADACRAALAGLQPDLFIVDDGFQHRALARDLDIVLLTGQERGALLPAGPLREPLAALSRAGVVLAAAESDFAAPSSPGAGLLGSAGDVHKVERVSLGLVEVVSPDARKAAPEEFAGRKVMAVAGIGRPEGFFSLLEDSGLDVVETMVFGDHADYSDDDWKRIRGKALAADVVVTTEKDLVKLARFGPEPGFLWALRLGLRIEGGEEVAERVAETVHRGAKV
jgi:tetraacyldisaccharide 4'-kinase